LLVLQRRDLTRLGRITAGSTSRAVAARARCPVAVTRTGQGSSQGRGAVLVGIDDLPSAMRLLPLAFAEASARRVRLTPIRMSTIGDSGGGPLPRTTRATAAALELAASLSNTLDRLAAQFPDVVVDDLTLAEDAVAVLRQVSASADLLVIGPFAVHERDRLTLGSRARQLIDTAHCPVLVAALAWTGTGNGLTPDAAHRDLGQRSAASSPP
jgi:nucleotide-binding universal stress UspA family protein